MNKKSNQSGELCPCGSRQNADDCCISIINGKKTAETPVQLMRSRYAAYKLGLADYVLESWHSGTAPGELRLDGSTQWTGLKIISASKISKECSLEVGYVEFIASYLINGAPGFMHERSRFVKERGYWRYIDGEQIETAAQYNMSKTGRNDPCVCGSGKKYKKCCGR